MAKKANFYPHKMIGIHFLLAILLLLSGFASASPKKLKIYINNSFDKESSTVGDRLGTLILKALMDQYPCADILRDVDIAVALGHDRERELLGAKADINEIMGALGGDYLISLNVTAQNGKVSMNASCRNFRTEKEISKKNTTADNDESALDAAESLAQDFVSALLDALPECYMNEWVGTISYACVFQDTSRNTQDVPYGKRTTEITIKQTTDADFEVRGTKKSAKASVKAAFESLTNSVSKGTVECGSRVLGEQPKTIPWNETEVEKLTAHADGKVDEAVANVAVNGNEYTISFIVPEIAGGIMVRDWTLTASGQCGSPVSKHENQSGKWPLQAVSGEAKGKIDPKNPDVLSGTKTLRPNLLFFPGGNETTTIAWNLKFIRGQSAQKKKE